MIEVPPVEVGGFHVTVTWVSPKVPSGVNYCAEEVNKAEDDVWLVYPWENVGVYDR